MGAGSKYQHSDHPTYRAPATGSAPGKAPDEAENGGDLLPQSCPRRPRRTSGVVITAETQSLRQSVGEPHRGDLATPELCPDCQ